MTLHRETLTNAAIGVAVCEELENISVLSKPGVAAAVWRRELPEEFGAWLDGLPVKRLPSARVLTRIADIRDTVMAVCNAAHVPYSNHRRFLINDAAQMAEQFATMMKAEVLRIRFDVVSDNACRKFHIDAVTARLVCTYRGPGTQYGISLDGAEPQRVFSVPTGSAFVLRGTQWPEDPKSGLLHRSPPIEGDGITRLVLVVDAVSADQDWSEII